MNTALLIIDAQKDFMPGGALAVPNGDEIISVINMLIPMFNCVIATKDFHPKGHVSFASSHAGKHVGDVVELAGVFQKLWPDHCIQHAEGSEIDPRISLPSQTYILHKGTSKEVDSYSAFFDNARLQSTGLEAVLKERKVNTLFVCGLATEYCVLYTVLDALDLGFQVYVVSNGCKGIDLPKGEVVRALETMKRNGAEVIQSFDVESFL